MRFQAKILKSTLTYCILAAACLMAVSACSPPPVKVPVETMFSFNEELRDLLLAKTGTLAISSINHAIYKKTHEYELVGVDAELERRPATEGEGIMIVSVVFVKYKGS